jgi:hypothetical protein
MFEEYASVHLGVIIIKNLIMKKINESLWLLSSSYNVFIYMNTLRTFVCPSTTCTWFLCLTFDFELVLGVIKTCENLHLDSILCVHTSIQFKSSMYKHLTQNFYFFDKVWFKAYNVDEDWFVNFPWIHMSRY